MSYANYHLLMLSIEIAFSKVIKIIFKFSTPAPCSPTATAQNFQIKTSLSATTSVIFINNTIAKIVIISV